MELQAGFWHSYCAVSERCLALETTDYVASLSLELRQLGCGMCLMRWCCDVITTTSTRVFLRGTNHHRFSHMTIRHCGVVFIYKEKKNVLHLSFSLGET